MYFSTTIVAKQFRLLDVSDTWASPSLAVLALYKYNYLIIKALRAVVNRAQQLGGLDLDILIKLFDTLIAPILTNGCEIWGTTRFNCLEKIMLKFCKELLGVPLLATSYSTSE